MWRTANADFVGPKGRNGWRAASVVMWDSPVCRLCEVTTKRGFGRGAGPGAEAGMEDVVVVVSILMVEVWGSGF